MTGVLVVERRDPPRVAAVLQAEGFTLMTAVNPGEARAVLDGFAAELVVVESPSLGRQVLEACAAIRSAVAVPLAVVSGPYSERDAISAFATGVDALVQDTVGEHELVARMRALLRRAPPPMTAAGDRLMVGPIVLDTARRVLFVDGAEVRMPKREFDIAELLMREAGRVVPRQTIMRELWGTGGDTKSLDVQVGRLRTRLADAEGYRRIVTVRGVGYRLLLDSDVRDGDEDVVAR